MLVLGKIWKLLDNVSPKKERCDHGSYHNRFANKSAAINHISFVWHGCHHI